MYSRFAVLYGPTHILNKIHVHCTPASQGSTFYTCKRFVKLTFCARRAKNRRFVSFNFIVFLYNLPHNLAIVRGMLLPTLVAPAVQHVTKHREI